ncbi:MAG: 7-cyano-7-deazaguanine synthase QueC [Thermoplasmata archaeon]|nr:MAG: 7-cyano-7-deazaguanine synthase QueC [Thermoplasmata archaeon]
MPRKKAVCLISGGLDSTVAATYAKSQGYEIYTLTIVYGQKHSKEVESAKKIAKELGALEHKVLYVPLDEIGGSALTDSTIEIPTRTRPEEIGSEIPSTYVPGRNIIFLSIAAAYAEVVRAETIFIGVNAIDYSGYPDCRPEFIRAMQEAIRLGMKTGVEGRPIKIETPLINMTKAEIVKLGYKLGAPLHLTWSCYRGGEKACGRCDSCVLRLKGFMEAGIPDPIEYEYYPKWYKEWLEEKNRKNL